MTRKILKNFSGILIAAAIFASPVMGATAGVREGGGGDIQCDAQIEDLSTNLESWIKNGGPGAGNLDLSSSFNPSTGHPYTYSEYDSAMITLIDLFNKTPDVNCVKPGDNGYPVDVDNSAKICKTFVDNGGVHMTCDRALFLGLTPDQQIEQNHHEFAINVPGLEPDTGAISTYRISIQLSASISDTTVRRLTVDGVGVSISYADVAKNSDGTLQKLTYHGAAQYCKSLGKHVPKLEEWASFAKTQGAIGLAQDGTVTWASMYNVLNDDGTANTVYYAGNGYMRATEDVGLVFWTSSSAQNAPDMGFGFDSIVGDFSTAPDSDVANVTCAN